MLKFELDIKYINSLLTTKLYLLSIWKQQQNKISSGKHLSILV